MDHSIIVTIHLFAAIAFGGTVFFEVVMLEGIRRQVGREPMRAVEGAIGRRARRIMPFVILLLYGAGFAMAWEYREALKDPFASGFATLFTIKIALALSVLAHFVRAVTWGARGALNARRSKLIHLSVFAHVVLIVFLAKAMFYLSW